MKVEIENYRDWVISFDTDSETFYCVSDSWDRDETKKSYAGVKKFIDDFIKENQVFKPVFIEAAPGSYYDKGKLKLVGIRKDGRFIYEEKGEKKQLSSYNERDYIVYNPDNDRWREEINRIEAEIDRLQDQKKEVAAKIVGTPLSELRAKYLNQPQ